MKSPRGLGPSRLSPRAGPGDNSCRLPGPLSTPQEARIFISVDNKAPTQWILTKLKKSLMR